MKTGTTLTVGRTGSSFLDRVDGKAVSDQQVIIAAWQTKEAKAPKRCVVRLDGNLASSDAVDEDGSPGFPCAMVSVQYAIGGLSRKVLIDCIGQSALVLWAESIEVLATWDERRVSRLAAQNVKPCKRQQVAAAINSDDTVGDTGPADARWLDVLAVDDSSDTDETSVHEIPAGARGVRFLNALASGANVKTADAATFIVFSAQPYSAYPAGIVETAIDGLTDQSVILVPAGARYMFVKFASGTIASFDEPSWVEWVMAPNTLFGG